MNEVLNTFNIYMLPPFLSLVVGIVLAVISVVKGKFRTENVLFAMICIGYNLMSPVFLSHHFFRGQFDVIMVIERSIHCVYVFLPSVVFLYLYKAFDFRSRNAVIFSFVFSAVISVFVWTDYYFYGFYEYSWGYSAKGGIAFQIFGAYGFLAVLYFIYFFSGRLKATENVTERLKLRYILLSFLVISFLTMTNVPAISGIDFYPFGNFMFIPLSIMAYGVLRYRLMDIQSILHVTFIWIVISSLILIPNGIVFYLVLPWMKNQDAVVVFLLLFFWFYINFLYITRMQPKIDQLFNKRRYDLRRLEIRFMENISYLRTMGDLEEEFNGVVTKALQVTRADLLFREGDSLKFRKNDGADIAVDPEIVEWFLGANHLVEKSMVETNPYYAAIREKMLSLFDAMECAYIVPLVQIQNDEIVGISFLGEKYNLKQLNSDEVKFINEIRTAVAVSISNSRMYQDLTDLKDNLELKVADRTVELLSAMEELEAVNDVLVTTNEELETAHRIAAMDMDMAANVQTSMFPKQPPRVPEWDIAFAFRPMSGVSGDFYDFYEDRGVLKGISLFDVSGHGIASGLITMIARSVIQRNFFSRSEEKLGSILEAVNRELMFELEKVDNYLTGLVLRFDGGTVEYVNAGHPDLLMKKFSTGAVRMVVPKDEDFKGSILGIREIEQSFRVLKFRMEEGDCLFLATDCIYESSNSEKLDYGQGRLERAFAAAPRDATADGILQHILNDFYQFIGDRGVSDDLTVLVVKRISPA
ncbi:MAG TPA: SpoIIE family protein phosphatase [Spirochaetota bacterium]|nr:SpoIIE family protein phosphatase [Spirochaetota bacterium]